MLQRHADAEVRRQRERRDHLRGTDGPAGGRSILGHAATVTERPSSRHRAYELPKSSEGWRPLASARSNEPLRGPDDAIDDTALDAAGPARGSSPRHSQDRDRRLTDVAVRIEAERSEEAVPDARRERSYSAQGDVLTWSDFEPLDPNAGPEDQKVTEVFNSVPWTRTGDVPEEGEQ